MLYPSHPLLSLLTGFLLSGAIALLAMRARALALSGALAACLVGGLILSLGGWLWGGALLTFFLTSTILGRVCRLFARKPTFSHTVDTHYVEPENGGRRDALQVLAYGGVAALCAVCSGLHILLYGKPDHLFLVLFLASLATANGDTWATEIGSSLGGKPHLLTTGRPVPAGTSGGITLAGAMASVAGAAVLALFAWPLGVRAAATIWGCGVFGVIVDSLLGATLQAQGIDPVTGNYTEKLPAGARPDRGLAWMRNDQVNTLSIICAAVLALCLFCKI